MNSIATVTNCLIHHNSAQDAGAGIIVYSTGIILQGTIITQNNLTAALTSYGGGLCLANWSSATGRNNIIYGNIAATYPDLVGSPALTYSCCSTPLPGPGNITANPLFVSGPWGAYYLSQTAAGQPVTSFCVDGGDPDAPMVTGTTRTDNVQDAVPVDMGYHYPVAVVPPTLDVTLTPINPPIQIPATGGNFQFNISITRAVGPQAPFTVWARIKNPNGSYTAPTLGPVTINTPVGVTVTRTRTQTVPGTWASGLYTYLGYANTTATYPAIDSSSFTFTKLADGSGPFVWDANCYGELFPGEIPASIPTTFAVAGASPNPFNPTTTFRFSLPEATRVTLIVYDVTGCQVAPLVNGLTAVGNHQVTFDGSNLSSGVYLYRLTAGMNSATGKMVLLK